MSEDGPWLSVPQAIVLEATRDIALALGLTGSDPALLEMKANRWLTRTVIPLEADADNEQRREALTRLQEEMAAVQSASPYLKAQQRLHRRLLAGVRTKAGRTPGGPSGLVDPVEFTRVALRGVDAIDQRTEAVMLYDLRINGSDLMQDLQSGSKRSAGTDWSHAPGQMQEDRSHPIEKWDCAGDPLPKLVKWARARWGEDSQRLPNCQKLLSTFRGQFGRVLGVNEKTMRGVRRQLASRAARRGGTPMHRR